VSPSCSAAPTETGNTLAGGVIVAYGATDMSKRRIGHMLSFSTGVMIYLSFVDLFGDASEKIGAVYANIGVSAPP